MTDVMEEPVSDGLCDLVHKTVETAALIQSCQVGDRGRCTAGVDWSPYRTATYSRAGAVDLVVLAETVRQLSMAVAHVGFAVPRASAFAMSRLTAEVGTGMDALTPSERVEVTAEATCRDVVMRAGALDRMSVDVDLVASDRRIGRGSSYFRVLPAQVYRRLRGSRRPRGRVSSRSRFPPTQVGCGSARDVLLGPAASDDGVHLVVDTTHRGYFDHPNDHVPGMVVVEASRQMYQLRRRRVPTKMDARFHVYLELAADPLIEIDDGIDGSPVIRTYQADTSAAEVSFGKTVPQ
ncbi:AfsA-related hotdog domain-containing protein [Tsukamurella sp. 8F]|uniref:AfsA-related hotdog domain-containing protein n=1 Tax=unclassified Tsukamurella TaxID=2633480 RepID=UPI0023B96C87|nr:MULTISPECIES: AfsA-related hotdog domain-containing protein [unclassified Tsukamurella]MDF0531099.1 AfsA-related hotdog domain-containing protein [Tsukamurella sp. 8J]MDF0588345.1 AfsA-related hotdog domain-containing protein [Tsukamurella sp. 8F]